MMGAMSPDHTHLSMTNKDFQRFSGMKKWKATVFRNAT